MHVAFVCVAAAGHVYPSLAVVAELVRRGHRVTYATSAKYADAVRSAGASFFPNGADLTAQLPRRGGWQANRENMAPMMTGLMERLILGAREEFPALLSRLEGDPPDALCYDAMTLTGKMAAAKLRLPDVALVPSYASNEHFSLRELMPAQLPPAMVEAWKQLRQLTADFAAEQGLADVGFMEGPPASLNICFIPRDFQPAGDTFDERFHFVGPCLGDRGSEENWMPPAKPGPLLFVSLGTTPLNDRSDFFRMCLEAFGNGGWQVAMAAGDRVDVSELGEIPGNVQVRPFFPQLAVLRHASAFLTHAGMNSTMEALYFGVPLVAFPQQPEQEANARRVEQLGLGRRLDPTSLSAELLRTAVTDVSTDPQIRLNIDRMKAIVRTSGGPAAAADAIENHVRNQSRPG